MRLITSLAFMVLAGCEPDPGHVACAEPRLGGSALASDGSCATLGVAYATDRMDGAEHFLRVLSMEGCLQWAAFTNEHKLTGNIRCMTTFCDRIETAGQASGQFMVGGDRNWSGELDEDVVFSAVGSEAVAGHAAPSPGLDWVFNARRVGWTPQISLSGSTATPDSLVTKALWCDVCPTGAVGCGTSWPGCIAEVCAQGW